MRKNGWFLGTLAATLVLAGCGGDEASSFAGASSSGSSGSSSSGGPTATASSITLLSTAPQIPSAGSTPATLTAIVKNSSNLVVPGATVSFSSTSGALAPTATTSGVTAGTTDQNGEAAATLTTPGDPTNRNITVTATAGKISATIVVAVVGTKIALTGPASLIQGATGTFNVSLTDSGGTGIAGATVTLASASSNTLSASSVVTNGTGQQTFTLTGTTAGSDTVTASALGLSATAPLTISNQSFAFTAPAPGTQVVVNTPIALAIKWTNAGAPVSGPVTFATSRGTITTPQPVTTAADGTATVMITSTTGGDTTVTASGAGVSAQLGLVFVATVAGAIDLQAGPDVIPTSGQSTVTATVTDGPTGNLVENATVDYTLTDATGGSLSVGTATTDVHGTAQTVYSATSAASSHNGVTITATVQGADCTT